jgi:hypothetical protein
MGESFLDFSRICLASAEKFPFKITINIGSTNFEILGEFHQRSNLLPPSSLLKSLVISDTIEMFGNSTKN